MINFLFPDDIKCIFCGNDIANFDPPYCDACKDKLSFNSGNRCLVCNVPIKNVAIICDHWQAIF